MFQWVVCIMMDFNFLNSCLRLAVYISVACPTLQHISLFLIISLQLWVCCLVSGTLAICGFYTSFESLCHKPGYRYCRQESYSPWMVVPWLSSLTAESSTHSHWLRMSSNPNPSLHTPCIVIYFYTNHFFYLKTIFMHSIEFLSR